MVHDAHDDKCLVSEARLQFIWTWKSLIFKRWRADQTQKDTGQGTKTMH